VVRTLVENRKLKAAVARLARGPIGFVKVAADSGLQLDGWIIRPPDFDSTKRYPLFYKVYGEPAAQTALDQWGSDYLWHLMLASRATSSRPWTTGARPRREAGLFGRRSIRRWGLSTRATRPPPRGRCGSGPGWTAAE
jgi:hypothetical protein